MINLNKVLLVGNLGADPEIFHTEKGNSVATISLATSRSFATSSGDKKTETQWHRAKVWGNKANDCAKKLQKGSKVFIEGELQLRTWTDKEGVERKTAEILVNEIIPLGRLKPEQPIEAHTEAEEDIPA